MPPWSNHTKMKNDVQEAVTHLAQSRLYELKWMFVGDCQEGKVWATYLLNEVIKPKFVLLPVYAWYTVKSEQMGNDGWTLVVNFYNVLGVSLNYITKLPT